MKKHNFSAGPSILPEFTVKNTAEAVLNFAGTGLSVMEVSHRDKEFMAVMEETNKLFKELLEIPTGYEVVFLGGGASLQFCMVPYNLLNKKAAYLNTGTWAAKALKEAKFFGEVIEVASSKDENYSYIPQGYSIPDDADYFHITTNNTIYGTEIRHDLDIKIPLVADMSSDIFSRPLDVSKYSIIYGGAQKNLAPAGLAFAIVKEDVLGKVDRPIPTMLNYKTHIDNGSMFNTPPVLPVFSALQTLKWLKAQGGLKAMEIRNTHKADLLYTEIERNKLFKSTVKNVEDRSIMNATFNLKNDQLKETFEAKIKNAGINGLNGHRSVGGYRASMYNALPFESVQALVDVMKEMEKRA